MEAPHWAGIASSSSAPVEEVSSSDGFVDQSSDSDPDDDDRLV